MKMAQNIIMAQEHGTLQAMRSAKGKTMSMPNIENNIKTNERLKM